YGRVNRVFGCARFTINKNKRNTRAGCRFRTRHPAFCFYSLAIEIRQSKFGNSSWGHSSVGRAPALQAGSQGFESPCLQSLKGVKAKSNNPGTFSDALAGA